MNSYPEYVEVNGKQYKINTDFRYALECNRIAEDETIGDFERSLGIICTLFGTEAIDDGKENFEIYEKLSKLALKYLGCGQEVDPKANIEDIDMDYIQDYPYIKTSFRSDYGINLDKEEMHWWEFYELMNGLSNSELGNCCILNRIRNLRNFDTKDIKDQKERKKIEKAKEQVMLKKKKSIKQKPTEAEINSAKEFLKNLGKR